MPEYDDDAPPEFDLRRYAPNFTAKEDYAAQQQGFEDATDKWASEMEYEKFAHYHDSVKTRAKAQNYSDLESAGAPYDEIGAMSKGWNKFPQSPDYKKPEDVFIPKDPTVRAGAANGLRNRLVRLTEKMARVGIRWDATGPVTKGDQWEDSCHCTHEWEEIERRMNAHGIDIADVAAGIQGDDVKYRDVIDAEVPPEHPGLRRVYAEHEKEWEAWHQRQPDDEEKEWTDEWDEDDEDEELR